MPDLAAALADADDRTLDKTLALALFEHRWQWREGGQYDARQFERFGAPLNGWTDGRAPDRRWVVFNIDLSATPRYASTPSGALAVIEAMGAKGFASSCFYDPALVSEHLRHDSRFHRDRPALHGPNARGIAHAATMPRAVAEAALLALDAAGDLPDDARAILTDPTP